MIISFIKAVTSYEGGVLRGQGAAVIFAKQIVYCKIKCNSAV